MGFPDGWSDADRYALLHVLKHDMTAFIYTDDERFAAALEDRLGKDKSDIVDAIRDLMQGLGFAIKSRNFQNEGFYVGGVEIYPFKILHDTMLAQPENHAGGVWDPDELRNGLAKMRTYRHVFDSNPDLFFRRTQIWSKSGLDMRAKFYLWRELYLEAKQKASEVPMSDAKVERIRLLREIFENVPPAPPPTPSTPTSMASPGLISDEITAAPRGRPPKSQTPKMRHWTVEEQELFVDLVVQLTLELQTTGESTLVAEIPERINRTTPSIMSKLLDIRTRLESKKSPLRAASIPKVLFDPTSAAHKIFTSNWGDKEDPYALGYHAIKTFHNRFLNVNSKKNRPPPRRMETRQRSEANGTSGHVTPNAIASSQPLKQQIHPVEKPAMGNSNGSSGAKPLTVSLSSPTQPVYSEFVRDCATMLKKWNDEETYRLCLALLKALPSRESVPMSKFYEKAAEELSGRRGHDLVMPGERILQLCRKRYGSLACFAAAVEGSDTATPGKDVDEGVQPAEDEEDPPGNTTAATLVGSTPLAPSLTASPTPRSPELPMAVDSPLSPSPPKPLQSYSVSGSAQATSYGKSNEAAMQILNQKASNTTRVQTTPIESSPSTHHFSPDHYDFDYDPGTPEDDDDEVKAEPMEEPQQRDRPAFATPREDDDHACQEPASPASYKVGGFVQPAHREHHHHRHRAGPYHPQPSPQHNYPRGHSSRVPGHVHMSSKTLVIQKTPGLCHCDDCVDRSRRRPRDHGTVHHRRRHHEVYAYAATDGHYVHQIAHKRIHHYHARDEFDDDEDDESDDVGEDDMEAIEGIWGKLMGPIQSDIEALEAKRREQQEREQDRQRHEQKQQWKQELRQQVRAEWKPVSAARSNQTSAFGKADA